jgi:hypothetical protein
MRSFIFIAYLLPATYVCSMFMSGYLYFQE